MGLRHILRIFSSLAKCITTDVEQFGRFIGNEIWPIKGRKYILNNLYLFERIVADSRHGRSIYQIYVLLVFSFLLAIIQCFYHEPTFILLTFDYFGLNKLSSDIKISKAIINIATLYFYKEVYFSIGKMKHFQIYKNLLLHDDRSFALDSKIHFWKLMLWTLRFYQGLVVLFELWLLSGYIQFCVALSQHPLGPLYLWPLAYLSMSVSFVLFSATSLLLTCVGGLAACWALLLVCIFFQRLNIQARRYLKKPIDARTSSRLLSYRRTNAETMRAEFEFGPLYGKVLLIFIITNIPSNVSFIALLVLRSVPNVQIYGMCAIIGFGQIIVFVCFHLLAAYVSNKIHSPYKTINSQFVRYQPRSLLAHIRIANNLQAFFVKKRYGIPYKVWKASFGLMSMFAFVKFMLLYTEAFLYGYNLYLQSTKHL